MKVLRIIFMVLAFISLQAHAKDERKPAAKEKGGAGMAAGTVFKD